MHHRYPWNTPMIVPFLTPQFWASTRFLSYLCKICILASLQIKVLAFILYYKIPFSFFFLPSKSCYRSDGWQDLISHGPCLCIGFKLSSCQSGHSLQEPGRKMHKIKTYQSLNITGKKVSIHQLPTDNAYHSHQSSTYTYQRAHCYDHQSQLPPTNEPNHEAKNKCRDPLNKYRHLISNGTVNLVDIAIKRKKQQNV